MSNPRSLPQAYYDPADIAEAAQYEAHRELDMPRRHRLEVNDEIRSEKVAITNIEQTHLVVTARTCAYCPALAVAMCTRCDEWCCEDDLIDNVCPDCLGLHHGAVPL